VAEFNQLQPLLAKALERETGDEVHELAVTAQGVAKAAEILAGQFTLVATNVPYRGANDLTPELNALIEVAHPRGRGDLATCFLERCIEFCASGGTPALVTPQAWLFIGPYRRLREHLLATVSLTFIAQLGKRAFETITGEVVNVNLATLTRRKPTEGTQFCSLDVTPLQSPSAKALALTSEGVELIPQLRQLSNPDARIVAEATRSTTLLREYADSYKGVATGDLERFIHYFWEHSPLAPAWFPFQGRVDMPSSYGGREQVLLWENGGGQLYRYVADRLGEDSVGAWIRGAEAWGRSGIAIGQMTSLPSTLYSGDLFDENTAAVVPKNEDDLPAIWAFCQSQKYHDEVKKLDNSSLKIPNLTLIKVPFDIAEWRTVAAEKYPNGLPEPFSSDPTQWLFSGHPKGCEHPLQVAVARLVGYRWPRQSGSLFQKCPALDPDGLQKHADKDGVVCFCQMRDEAPAADRLRTLLAEAYGAEWSHAKERQLIAASGSKADSLEDWLLNDFFRQHCEIFQKRPFVWHIWDGLKDGFNALVNYHALAGADGVGARTLEKLAYAYLERDWIERQRDAVKQKVPGAEGRLAAAQELKQQLERILGGEPPYDIFVRWKPLHQQAVGWQPDMNDGVRLNIRPFMLTSVGGGKKECGLFRSHPGSSIKWGKDKGKEPARPRDQFPWFWSWDEQGVDFTGNAKFDGNRWNDCHYTTAMKQEARKAKGLK
jgi:N-6 DNA Methylase